MKKRLLLILLGLALIAGIVIRTQMMNDKKPDDQNVPAPQTASLPNAGDVINGFEALETRDFSMINASVVRFIHQKTGAVLYYIANESLPRWADVTCITAPPPSLRIRTAKTDTVHGLNCHGQRWMTIWMRGMA